MKRYRSRVTPAGINDDDSDDNDDDSDDDDETNVEN